MYSWNRKTTTTTTITAVWQDRAGIRKFSCAGRSTPAVCGLRKRGAMMLDHIQQNYKIRGGERLKLQQYSHDIRSGLKTNKEEDGKSPVTAIDQPLYSYQLLGISTLVFSPQRAKKTGAPSEKKHLEPPPPSNTQLEYYRTSNFIGGAVGSREWGRGCQTKPSPLGRV